MTCQFCPGRAKVRCHSLVEKFMPVRWLDLAPGDQVHKLGDERGRPPAIVISVEEESVFSLRMKLTRIRKGVRQVKQIVGHNAGYVQALRECRCNVPCCELHHRDVGDVFYCREHWSMGIDA